MLDLLQLLPHSKKDAKLDTKSDRGVINEVADMKVREGRSGGCLPCAGAACRQVSKHRSTCMLLGTHMSLKGLHQCALF